MKQDGSRNQKTSIQVGEINLGQMCEPHDCQHECMTLYYFVMILF